MSDAPPFEGMRALVTGVLPGMSRSAAQASIVDLGAALASGISATVDLVIAGDGAGVSKLAKAETHGCRIMLGQDFVDLVHDFNTDPSSVDVPPAGFGMTFAEFAALSEDEDADRPPRPGEPAWVPMEQRHLVTLISLPERVDGRWKALHRMSCQCGRRWTSAPVNDRFPVCPDADQPLTA